MLVARRHVGEELLAELAAEAGVEAGDVAAQIRGVLRGQAAAGLRAGRAIGVGAGRVGSRITGAGLVVLATEFDAGGERMRAEYPADVEIEQRLPELVIAGAETGRAGRTERSVERVLQAIGERVAAVIEAGVVVPLAPLAAQAGDRGGVAVLAQRQRAVAIRIDLLPVGDAVRVAEVVGALGVALVEGAEGVQLGAVADRQFGVEPTVDVLGLAIAQPIVALAGQGQVVGGLLLEERNLVEAGAIGAVALLVLQAHPQETAFAAQRGTHLPTEEAGLAVGDGAADRFDVGVVRAVAQFQRAALGGIVEDHVDHAGHGIGPVLRAGAVAQHFDALDRADRNGIEVDRRVALADFAVGVDQRAGVAALAVHQHQHLVGAEPAQLRGTHVVGAAGVGLAREIEGRQQGLQGAAEFAVEHAGLADVLGGQHVDGGGGFKHRAVPGTGTGDDDGVQIGGASAGVLGEGGSGESECDGDAERRREGAGHGNSWSDTGNRGGQRRGAEPAAGQRWQAINSDSGRRGGAWEGLEEAGQSRSNYPSG